MSTDLAAANAAPDGDGTRMARLFWAVPVDALPAAHARAECARVAPMLATPRIHWQPPENWHLTLCFLGNCRVATALAMAAALRLPLSALAPFSVSLGCADWFPAVQHPLVIALPAVPSPSLLALAATVAEAARDCGVPQEARPFRGHVSLARVKHGVHPLAALPAVPVTASLHVERVALLESVPTPAGVRYRSMLTLPLRAASQ